MKDSLLFWFVVFFSVAWIIQSVHKDIIKERFKENCNHDYQRTKKAQWDKLGGIFEEIWKCQYCGKTIKKELGKTDRNA